MTDQRPEPLVPAERKPLSKKQRFEIFKRDCFTCQYCGRTPPSVVLEVDHVIAVAKGGTNDDTNLITSCADCNRGKSDGTLEAKQIDNKARIELLAEREAQAEAYNQLLTERRARLDDQVEEIIYIYDKAFDGWTLLDQTRPSIRRFLERLPYIDVADAMELACSRGIKQDKVFRYFCGVCWNKIRERGG